jgi:hypothetical protein
MRILDPDPAIFVIDLQDAGKKLIFNTIFSGSGSWRPKNMWIRIRNTVKERQIPRLTVPASHFFYPFEVSQSVGLIVSQQKKQKKPTKEAVK